MPQLPPTLRLTFAICRNWWMKRSQGPIFCLLLARAFSLTRSGIRMQTSQLMVQRFFAPMLISPTSPKVSCIFLTKLCSKLLTPPQRSFLHPNCILRPLAKKL